jgi:hypothetical protein
MRRVGRDSVIESVHAVEVEVTGAPGRVEGGEELSAAEGRERAHGEENVRSPDRQRAPSSESPPPVTLQ